MDSESIVVHELKILGVHSTSLLMLMIVSTLFGLENLLFWPGLIVIIFVTLIQDNEAYQSSPTIGMEFTKFLINLFMGFCAIMCAGLVCHHTEDLDNVVDKKGDGTVVAIECDYGNFGLGMLAFLTSLFLISSIRTVIAALGLAFTILQSIWIHFHDPID